jgi:long-chain acyl-CoA synthetase
MPDGTPNPRGNTPQERQHLGTLLADMEAWGASDAIIEHRGVRRFVTSYGEVAQLAHRFAAELARRGIAPGERVVLWGRNSAEWVAAFFGCIEAGVLAVPLDASGSAEFARRVVQEVAPRLIVADAALVHGADFAPVHLAFERLQQSLPETGGATLFPALTPESPLQILFTSGTTGTPKGIVHTHRNLLASLLPIEREIRKYRRYERLVHPLRFLHTLPLSHVFGQFMGLWVPPLLGAAVHYESRSTGSRIAALIPRERIHVLAAVPRTLELLRAHLLANDPATAQEIAAAQGLPIAKRWWLFRRVHRRLGLRFWAAVCGGATLPAGVEQFWTTLGFALIQGYGLTETAALVTLNHPFKIAQGSLGAPLPGRALRVSAAGELEVKGDMVSTATWQNGGLVERDDPWLATGDLASLEDDGRVHFLGRSGQRLVTSAGLNVYLQDVEAALEAQPEVQEAVALAVGAPALGGDAGEVPGAVVVARGGSAAAGQAVARANETLAAHQQVRQWWLWPELALPRTGSGKVARKAVQTWVQGRVQGRGGDAQEHGGSPDDPLVALLLSVGGRPGPLGDAALLDEDWGLDSMGRVALAAALEQQAGIAASEGQQLPLRTLGDLRAVLAASPVRVARGGADAEDAAHLPQAPEKSAQAAPVRAEAQVPALPPLWRYPAWPCSGPVRRMRALFIEAVLRPLVWLLAAPRVYRTQAAQPLPGPMLLISNHRTAMDAPLLLYALPGPVRRRVAVAMSGEMLAGWQQSWRLRALTPELEAHRRWWGPFAALLLQGLLNVFPLPRTAGFRSGFEHAGRALDRGFSVLIFPEGRRGPGDGLLPFKGGFGLLAEEAFVPILPMGLILEDSAKQARLRGRAAIALGAIANVAAGDTAAETTEKLRAQVESLLMQNGESAGL